MTVSSGAFGDAFAGRRVLVTGHTGFKGSWLTRWLLDLGADVTGYALAPDTEPSLFHDVNLGASIDSHIGDVRSAAALTAVVAQARPEIVFHLAAQPLVRRSYAEPAYTFEVNVQGTVNLLQAVRASEETRVLVNITTDKVYANPETGEPFDEDQPLGGHDPYSASKAASEIVTASYRSSFFSAPGSVSIATARAGNVIGGGDWAQDRLIPDCARALEADEAIVVRNPASIRPWQHVLEPLSGYLHLAASLLRHDAEPSAFNFGPDPDAARTVGEVVDRFVGAWGEGSWHVPELGEQPHEAAFLRLDIGKAARELHWHPVWGFDETVAKTAAWYKAYSSGNNAADLMESDLSAYVRAAAQRGVAWASQGERA